MGAWLGKTALEQILVHFGADPKTLADVEQILKLLMESAADEKKTFTERGGWQTVSAVEGKRMLEIADLVVCIVARKLKLGFWTTRKLRSVVADTLSEAFKVRDDDVDQLNHFFTKVSDVFKAKVVTPDEKALADAKAHGATRQFRLWFPNYQQPVLTQDIHAFDDDDLRVVIRTALFAFHTRVNGFLKRRNAWLSLNELNDTKIGDHSLRTAKLTVGEAFKSAAAAGVNAAAADSKTTGTSGGRPAVMSATTASGVAIDLFPDIDAGSLKGDDLDKLERWAATHEAADSALIQSEHKYNVLCVLRGVSAKAEPTKEESKFVLRVTAAANTTMALFTEQVKRDAEEYARDCTAAGVAVKFTTTKLEQPGFHLRGIDATAPLSEYGGSAASYFLLNATLPSATFVPLAKAILATEAKRVGGTTTTTAAGGDDMKTTAKPATAVVNESWTLTVQGKYNRNSEKKFTLEVKSQTSCADVMAAAQKAFAAQWGNGTQKTKIGEVSYLFAAVKSTPDYNACLASSVAAQQSASGYRGAQPISAFVTNGATIELSSGPNAGPSGAHKPAAPVAAPTAAADDSKAATTSTSATAASSSRSAASAELPAAWEEVLRVVCAGGGGGGSSAPNDIAAASTLAADGAPVLTRDDAATAILGLLAAGKLVLALPKPAAAEEVSPPAPAS